MSRLAEDPMGSSVQAMASMLYLLSSKLVMALTPLNLIAAMSYASAASSSVAAGNNERSGISPPQTPRTKIH